jgi:hypothetical protein
LKDDQLFERWNELKRLFLTDAFSGNNCQKIINLTAQLEILAALYDRGVVQIPGERLTVPSLVIECEFEIRELNRLEG